MVSAASMSPKRINGQQLAQNIGSEVIVLGQIKKISSNGNAVELLTPDNVSINTTLPEPIDGAFEGYIEIHGTAQSKSTINCKFCVTFPKEQCTDFEADKYHKTLMAIHVIGDKKWKICTEDEPY